MSARFSYGESRLDTAAAKRLAVTTLDEISDLMAVDIPDGIAECCEANAAARALELVLLRDLKGWASLLEVKGSAARPLRDLAAWKVERLVMGLMAIEEALLEREPLDGGEEPGEGRRVMSIEVRP